MPDKIGNNIKIFWLHVFAFFLLIHYAVILYSGSTFLSKTFGEENIWIIYFVASALTIILNLTVTKILRRFDVRKLTQVTLVLAFLNMLYLYYSNQFMSIGMGYILYTVLADFLIMLTSIMIEDLSRDSVTGSIRGKLLSVQHFGLLLATFITSFVIDIFSFQEIFLASALFIFISFIVFVFYVVDIPKITIHQKNLIEGFKKIKASRDLRYIIYAEIALYTFYSLMVIYMPFKLLNSGIPLTTYLSVLLPFALLPFLFIPIWLGYFEDAMSDEKEFLIFAFIGIIVMLIIIAFTTSASLWVWGIILFMSRVVAACAETSISSYLFKKINSADTAIISIFTSSQTLAYLIFTPIFAILLRFTDLKTLFLSVSFLLCFVLVLISKIHDTKNYQKHKEWTKAWDEKRRQNWREIWRRTNKRVG